jgi:hypothetical protein
MNFGAFVAILPGKEGLVHISQLAPQRVERVEDVVKPGDQIMVKVMEIDSQGRINLSRKAMLGGGAEGEGGSSEAPRGNGRFGGGDDGGRGNGAPPPRRESSHSGTGGGGGGGGDRPRRRRPRPTGGTGSGE